MLKFQARVRNNYIFEFSMLEPGSKVRPLLINNFKKQISSKALAFYEWSSSVSFSKRIQDDEREEDEDRGINSPCVEYLFCSCFLVFPFFFSSTKMEIPAQRRTTSREIKL